MEETQIDPTTVEAPPSDPVNQFVKGVRKKYYPNKTDEEVAKALYASPEAYRRTLDQVYNDNYQGKQTKQQFLDNVKTKYGDPFPEPVQQPVKKKDATSAPSSTTSSSGSADQVTPPGVTTPNPVVGTPPAGVDMGDFMKTANDALLAFKNKPITAPTDNTRVTPAAQTSAYVADASDKKQAAADLATEAKYRKQYGNFWGGVHLGVNYATSKLATGGSEALRGITTAANILDSNNPMAPANRYYNNVMLDELDEKAKMGVDPNYNQHGIVGAIGGVLQTVPALLASESTGGASFFFQGLGAADKQVNELKKQGVKFDNHTDDLYRIGSGIINYGLTKIDAGPLLNNTSSSLKNNVVGQLVAEGVNNLGTKLGNATSEDVTAAFMKPVMNFNQKLKQFGGDYLNSFVHNTAVMGAMAVADHGLKATVNVANDKAPFKQDLSDLGERLKNILTVDAPLFSTIGAATNMGKLFKDSPYANTVVQDLQKDSSPENVNRVKTVLTNIGLEKGWGEKEINDTNQAVDLMADVASKVPKNIPPSNFGKAVDLVMNRRGLENVLDYTQKNKGDLDPAIADKATAYETLIKTKIEQANDKLAEVVTGKNYEYFAKDGKYYKQVPGETIEEISKDRFDLENGENTTREQSGINDTENVVPGGPPVTVSSAGKKRSLDDEDVEYLKNNGSPAVKSAIDQKEDNVTLDLSNDQVAADAMVALEKRDQDIKDAESAKNKAQSAAAKPAESVSTPAPSEKPVEAQVEDAFDSLKKPVVNEEAPKAADTTPAPVETPEPVAATPKEAPVKAVNEKPEPAEITPARQKAIDAVTHGIVVPENIKEGDPSARFDFGMSVKEKRKALADIHAGDYETAPARKMLDKLEEFEKNDDYPVIQGLGGGAVRNQGATSADIQQGIDDAKKYRLDNGLTPEQIEKNNAALADLGFTHEDAQNYENYRRSEATDFTDGYRRSLGRTKDDVRAEPDQTTSAAQGSGDQSAQTESGRIRREPERIEPYYVSTPEGHKEVAGEPVPNNHGLDLFVHSFDELGGKGYGVSEGSTGLQIGKGLTKQDAIDNALEKINSKSSTEMQGAIEKKREGGLQSPRGIKTQSIADNIDALSDEEKEAANSELEKEGLTLQDIKDYELSKETTKGPGSTANDAEDLRQRPANGAGDEIKTGSGKEVQNEASGSEGSTERALIPSSPEITKDGELDQNSVIRDNSINDRDIAASKTPERTFIDRVGDSISKGEKLNIIALRKLASELGIIGDDIKLQDLAETAVVSLGRSVALDPELTDQQKLDKMVDLYNNQPSFLQRSSDRILLAQYSTPLPTAFIGGLYGKAIKPYRIFEPSAGNGLLTVDFDPRNVIVNEIDKNRLANLNIQGFRLVSNRDAAVDFGSKANQDVVIANPPFGKSAEKVYDGYRVSGLDEQMIINALQTMKDNGRGIFIMGGHNKYDAAGRLASDRTFFNYLYSHYNVSDVINMDGALFKNQGTTFPNRMILINGRKSTVSGVSPLKDDVANKPVSSFQELYDRVQTKILSDENRNLLQPGVDAERNNKPLVYGADTFVDEATKPSTVDTIPENKVSPADTGSDTEPRERAELDRGSDRSTDIGNKPEPGGRGTSGNGQLSALSGNDEPVGTRQNETTSGDKPGRSDSGLQRDRPQQDSRELADQLVTHDKVPYQPASNSTPVGSVIPSNMATEAKRTLQKIEDEHGNIDVFVSSRLGYQSREALYNAFSAEQVDALAMGIAQMEAGQGMIIGDMTGVGKGRSQPLTAKILTKSGFKPMGDLKIGDSIISVDGNETKIVGIYPQGIIDVFEIEFTDGTKTEASADHLWETQNKHERDNRKKFPDAVYSQPKIRTTSEMAHHISRSVAIPVVEPINFDYKEVPIDPYLLGVILGDGCIRKDSVQVVMADAEILASVTSLLPEGLSPQFRGRYHYDLSNGKRGLQNKLMQALRLLELSGKTAAYKFIPDIYLINSVDVRLAILQGLIDTDGYVNKKGSCMYYTVSNELADDVQWLVQSLGGIATRGIKKTYRLDCHVVYIKLSNGMNPCRLIRKAQLIKNKDKYPPIKYVKSVTFIGQKECQCIKVDHPRSLYITDDFIVTHNTAAGMIRYGIKTGKTPIFLTEKATLFSDMYRDLVDIGSAHYVPFIINDKSSDNDPTITDANGTIVHKVPVSAVKTKAYANGQIPNGYDFIMATYSQFTSSKPSDKKTFLQRVSADQPMIMDESHNVSGTSNSGEFFQDVLQNVQGVMYLSATFAKRPDNMPVYAGKTAMSEANMSHTDLVEAIRKGGVALQEIVSSQLVESGQMLRRERDFTGVKNNFIELSHLKKDHRDTADKITDIVRDIISFQRSHVNDIINSMDEEAAANGAMISKRLGTADAGVNNVPFSSKVFNVIDQMLFAIKAESVADRAIEHLKNNLKPVIAFKSTMESFLKNSNIEVGDTIEKPNFALSLSRGLKSAMTYTETNPQGDKTKGELSVSELTPEGQDAYNAIVDKIKSASVDISISPIDVIIKKIQDAGYKVGEITGRKMQLDFQPNGSANVKARDDRDIKKIVRQFNNGEGIDVVLLNSSGATGLSMHASKTFKDQRQRVMLTHQLELDINKEIQKRGRIDRSGQVVRGIYDTVFSAIPAEQRLAMMFKAKLKSLDANTTSSQKSKTSEEIGDFLNKYGDKVVVDYLKENPELNEALLDPFGINEMDQASKDKFETQEGAAHKVTGRVAILPSGEQAKFYDDVTNRYLDLIQYLDDNNLNDLEVKSVPLDAETVESKPYIVGKGGNSPFGRDSILETVKSNILKKPLSKDELEEQITENLQGVTAAQKQKVLVNTLGDFYDARIKMVKDAIQERYVEKRRKVVNKKKIDADELANQLQTLKDFEKYEVDESVMDLEKRWENIDRVFQAFRVGEEYDVPNTISKDGTTYNRGVFLGFETNGFAPSNIRMRFAMLDGRRIVQVPLSQTDFVNAAIEGKRQMRMSPGEGMRANWGNIRSDNAKETRHIVTGNILQAYDGKGQLVAYTTADGQLKKGILMPSGFKPEKSITVPATRALKTIVNLGQSDTIFTSDKTIGIQKLRGDRYNIQVAAAKSTGGLYFLDPDLRSIVDGNNFNTIGGKMVGEFDQVLLPKLLTVLQNKFGKTFKVDDAGDSGPTPSDEGGTNADYIFDQSNIKSVLEFLDKLKIKAGRAFSSLVPIPPVVFNKAIDMIKAIVKVTNSAQKAVRVAVRYLKDNKASKEQISSFVQEMQDFFENTPALKKMFAEQAKGEDSKTALQSAIDTTMAEAEQSIQTGLTNTEIGEYRTKLTDILAQARKMHIIKYGEASASKAAEAIRAVNEISRNNPESVQTAVRAVYDFFNNVGDKTDLKQSNAARAQLRPFVNKKENVLPGSLLKDLVMISPDSLSPADLKEYKEITSTLAEQLNGSLPGLIPNDQISAFTDRIKTMQEDKLKAKLAKQYADFGATEDMSLDELTDIKNTAAKLAENDQQEPVEKVNKKRAILNMFIDDALANLQSKIDNVEPEYRAQVEDMMKLSTDNLSTGEMKLYNQVLNNVAINNDYQGVGLFQKYHESDRDMQEFTNFAAPYQNQFRQISFGQFGKDLVKGSTLSKLSLTDKFFHVNSEREVGNKLDSMLAFPINQGFQGQQQDKAKYNEGFRDIVKKNGLKRDNMFRVGVFSDLNEHDLSLGTTKQEQFEDGVERLRQAVDRLRPFKTKHENAMFTTLSGIYDQVKAAASPADLSDMLTPEEKSLYDYTQGVWNTTYPKLKENTTLYSFDDLGSIENYAHRKYYNVGGKIDVNLIDNNGIDVRTGSTTGEANTKIGRTVRRTLPAGKIIDYNIFNSFSKGLNETLNDIHTLGSRIKANRMLKSKELPGVIDISDRYKKTNTEILTDGVKLMVNIQRGMAKSDADLYGVGPKVTNWIRQAFYAHTTGQLLAAAPQYASSIAFVLPQLENPKALWMSMKMFGLGAVGVDKEFRDLGRDLMHKVGGGTINRDLQGDQQLNDQLNNAAETLFGQYTNENLAEVIQKLHDAYFYSLKLGDRAIALHTWMAGYVNSLIKQGIIGKTSEFTKEFLQDHLNNPNQLAATEAEALVTMSNNESDSSRRPEQFVNKTGGQEFLNDILYPLKKFAVSMYNKLMLGIRNVSEHNGGEVDGAKLIIGAIASSVVYGVISKFILGPVYDKEADLAIKFAGEWDHESQMLERHNLNRDILAKQKFEQAKFNLVTSTVSDIFLNGQNAVVENGVKATANLIYQGIVDTDSAPKNTVDAYGNPVKSQTVNYVPQQLFYSGNNYSEMMGVYADTPLGVLFDIPTDKHNAYNVLHEQFKYKGWAGLESKRILFSLGIPTLSGVGLLPADVNRVNDRVKKRMEKLYQIEKEFTIKYQNKDNLDYIDSKQEDQ